MTIDPTPSLWRRTHLARMAAERADLLWSVRRIDAETPSTVIDGAAEDWPWTRPFQASF